MAAAGNGTDPGSGGTSSKAFTIEEFGIGLGIGIGGMIFICSAVFIAYYCYLRSYTDQEEAMEGGQEPDALSSPSNPLFAGKRRRPLPLPSRVSSSYIDKSDRGDSQASGAGGKDQSAPLGMARAPVTSTTIAARAAKLLDLEVAQGDASQADGSDNAVRLKSNPLRRPNSRPMSGGAASSRAAKDLKPLVGAAAATDLVKGRRRRKFDFNHA